MTIPPRVQKQMTIPQTTSMTILMNRLQLFARLIRGSVTVADLTAVALILVPISAGSPQSVDSKLIKGRNGFVFRKPLYVDSLCSEAFLCWEGGAGHLCTWEASGRVALLIESNIRISISIRIGIGIGVGVGVSIGIGISIRESRLPQKQWNIDRYYDSCII
jgi:hypothetical protein